MSKNVTVKTNIRPELKEQASVILDSLSLGMSSAIEITLRQIVIHGGLPFEVKIPREIPNQTTRNAMKDAEEGRVFRAKHLRDLLDD